MSRPVLALKGLDAGYHDHQVLFGLDLDLADRQVTAVLGPGGCGKTTLVRILGGNTMPGMWWRGRLHQPEKPPVAVRQVPCSLPGASCPPPSGSCQAGMRRTLSSVWSPRPDLCNELVGLVDQPPVAWHGWQRQLFRFTEACAREASLYIFDEPDANTPLHWQDGLAAKIREHGRRASVLVVTHNLRFARRCADLVAILVEGRVLEAGRAAEVFSAPRCARAAQYLTMGS